MPQPHYQDRACTGNALIMGTARGKRAFFLGADGWLRGVTYRQVWLPGENVAQCMVTKRPTFRPDYQTDYGAHVVNGVDFAHGKEGATPRLVDGWAWNQCKGMERSCACGFYAYHRSGHSTYGFVSPAGGWGQRVHGVIEGYGKVILGPEGYRAQKARVLAVALRSPSEAEADGHRRRVALTALRDQAQYLLDEPLSGFAFGTYASLTFTATALGVAGFTGNAGWLAGAGASGLYAIATEYVSRRTDGKGREHLRKMIASIEEDLTNYPESFADAHTRFRENYPDVATYESQQRMDRQWPTPSLAHLAEGGDE